MRPGSERLTVQPKPTEETPNPAAYEVPAHVSWSDSSEVLSLQSGLGYAGKLIGRELVATYTPSHEIPNGATVTWRGDKWQTDGPEELHTDMQGRLHHKTRRLRATEQKQ